MLNILKYVDEPLNALIERSDGALYRAKSAGCNRVLSEAEPDDITVNQWVSAVRAKPGVNSGLRSRLPRRDRLFALVVVEATAGLAAQPAGFDVFDQQGAGSVLGVRQAFE